MRDPVREPERSHLVCVRAGDRHFVKHERALVHDHRPAVVCLHTRIRMHAAVCECVNVCVCVSVSVSVSVGECVCLACVLACACVCVRVSV